MKLFRKNMDPRCAYCEKGRRISEEEVVCIRRGVVPAEFHCRKFRYDPLKRVPPRPAELQTDQLKPEDFSL